MRVPNEKGPKQGGLPRVLVCAEVVMYRQMVGFSIVFAFGLVGCVEESTELPGVAVEALGDGGGSDAGFPEPDTDDCSPAQLAYAQQQWQNACATVNDPRYAQCMNNS